MSSHDKLRQDTECQNCGHNVAEIYCPHCGQKNTETRQSFHHLAAHVVEDITHYDSGFWRTIKFLLFRPAKLTQEYLDGRRQMYVPPVKLYIFISFMAFLLMGLLPNMSITKEDYHVSDKLNQQDADIENVNSGKTVTNTISFGKNSFSSLEELQAYQDSAPKEEKYSDLSFWMMKKTMNKFRETNTDEILPKFLNALSHNFPKLLFIYMPIFAFWLWLFHSKKNWYFFDHSIFTLHYFSLMLLLSTFIVVIDFVFYIFNFDSASSTVTPLLILLFMLYSFIYFFVAHTKMYHQKKILSIVKGSFLFAINLICMSLAIFALAFYTFLNIH